MPRFVLEIGTEEIPARFLSGEEADLASLFEKKLAEEHLAYASLVTFASPRRLALVIEDLAATQPEREEVMTGPPAAVAWDKSGQPTRALQGFLKSHNAQADAVFTLKNEKGEYSAIRKMAGGKDAREILSRICPEIIAALPFQKRMRWGGGDFAYARPIRWLLALLDDQVVPFDVAGVESGRSVQGHRVHAPGLIQIETAQEYEKALAGRAKVVPDPARRRQKIMELGNYAAQKVGGRVLWREDLLEEVCGLVEHPVPLMGSFDPAYLAIPDEVLLTSMQTHQKSFGVVDSDGKLLPHFLTVLNLEPLDPDLVRAGWEKVLRARLEDARFFWESDCRTPLEDWQAKLEKVIFIGSLGSMADQGRRLEALVDWLARKVAPDQLDSAKRAAVLAKADLVSGMVGEFDTLQGIMGGIYAARAGEGPAVATAIGEQYLPAGPDSSLPGSVAGALLSAADKADRLAGCFGLAMIPGGASDPNGLRRAALGLVRIVKDQGWDIPVGALLARALELYGQQKWKLEPDAALEKLADFVHGRLRSLAVSEGHSPVTVDAVAAAGFDRINDFYARLAAVEAFLSSPDLLPSAQLLKRVGNITRKEKTVPPVWQDELLQEEAEVALSRILRDTLPEIDRLLAAGDYPAALAVLESLQQPVGAFFDQVMVMAEDPDLRRNRLGMLKALAEPYGKIADFSALAI